MGKDNDMIHGRNLSKVDLDNYTDWELSNCIDPFRIWSDSLLKPNELNNCLIVMGGTLRGLNRIISTSKISELILIEQSDRSIKVAHKTVFDL